MAERVEQRSVEPFALRVDRQHPVGIAAGKHVSDRRGRGDRHAPRDARVPPLVLILDEAGVGPAYDDGDELIAAAAADEVGDVELRGRPRILCDPDGPAVQHHVQHALGASEAQHDPPPGPVAGDREGATVDAGGILLGDEGRSVLERHRHIRVPGYVVTEHRPEARHLNGVPPARSTECPGRVVGAPDEPELPVAVQRPLEGGVALEGGARREPVQAGELRALPAPASARMEESLERVGAHVSASRNDCAAASGAIGLKKTPDPSSPAATNRGTPGARHGVTISMCSRAPGHSAPSKGR